MKMHKPGTKIYLFPIPMIIVFLMEKILSHKTKIYLSLANEQVEFCKDMVIGKVIALSRRGRGKSGGSVQKLKCFRTSVVGNECHG